MKKFILLMVLLILLVLAASNYKTITGLIAKDDVTLLDVTPKKIHAGEKIQIEIQPGRLGTNEYLTIHSKNGLRKARTHDWCNTGRRCYEDTVQGYVTSTSWNPGRYYVRAYDYVLEDYIAAWFTIE